MKLYVFLEKERQSYLLEALIKKYIYVYYISVFYILLFLKRIPEVNLNFYSMRDYGASYFEILH